MASGSFSSKSYNGFCLYVEWSSTENVSANTSTVTANVYVKSYSLYATARSGSYITINGNKKSWTKTFNISDSSSIHTTLATTHTVTVPHNSDGAKSITIKANMEFNGTYSGTYISDLTASKTVTLDTIPRSSSFSIPSSTNTGSSLTVTINPSSSSFRHKIRFEIDGASKYTSGFIAAGTKTFSYTIPHSWLPKVTSKKMTVYLYTYTASSDTYIARVSKTITVNVPSSVKPSVSKLTATLASGGLDEKYVQGKSTVKLVATATAGNGSTITSYIFKGVNISGTSSSYTGASNTKTSSIIQSSGTLTYKVAAKDARGRISDYKTVSIAVYAYAAPQIASVSAQRCSVDGKLDTNGTYAKVTAKVSYSSIGGANPITITLSNSSDNFAKKTTISTTDNAYSGVYGSGVFETDSTYDIKVIITDKYNSHEEVTTLNVAQRTLNIARYGNGVAIGGLSTVEKKSDSGLFECHWPARIGGLMVSTGGIRVDAEGTDNKYFEARRANPPDVTDDEYKDPRFQLYIGDSGFPTCRYQHLNDNGEWVTKNYWRLENDGMRVSNTMTAPRGRFTTTTDASPTAQNNVPLRVGDEGAEHLDIDSNEIIAKDSPTTPGTLGLSGSTVDLYSDSILTLRVGSDETSKYVESDVTYKRTYDGSPNMYITSNGVFGRSTSSSQRYKTDIENVNDDTLNPYNILDIPVRQYKYNEDNVPIGKDVNDLYVGLIAEEVAKAYPAAAEYNEDGQVEMWNIKVIVPAMLKIIQDQQKTIEELKQKVDDLKMNA